MTSPLTFSIKTADGTLSVMADASKVSMACTCRGGVNPPARNNRDIVRIKAKIFFMFIKSPFCERHRRDYETLVAFAFINILLYLGWRVGTLQNPRR